MVWFGLVDFGLGFGAQNLISSQRAAGQPYNQYAAIGLGIGFVVFFAFLLLIGSLSTSLGPSYLKGFSSLSDEQKAGKFLWVAFLYLAYGTGTIMYKVWYGEQKGHLSNILGVAAGLVALAGIWVVTKGTLEVEDRLFWSLTCFIAPAAAFPIVAAGYRLVRIGSELKLATLAMVSKVLKIGFQFWLFALMSAFVLSTDYLVMSQVLGAEDIATYSIVTKVLGFTLTIYVAALMAFWPVCAEYKARGDFGAIRSSIKRYLGVGTVAVAAATCIFSAFREILSTILTGGQSVVIPFWLVVLCGGYFAVRVWTDTFSIVLLSMSELGIFWIWVPVQAIVSLGLQIGLAPFLGVYGIILGLTISFLVTVAWILPLRVSRILRGT
jgi:O-antigen/teichoic acid export membrane protein